MASISHPQPRQELRRVHRHSRPRPGDPRPRVRRLRRPVRLRQVDPAAHHRRARSRSTTARSRSATRVNGVPAAQRDIAMVFQDYALYPHMTVDENMAFGLEMRGMPKAEIDAARRAAAAMLHIEPISTASPKALSGGQRQRVAMGRAIVRDPKVFLFDEPLSNLDAKLRGAGAHRDQGAVAAAADHDGLRHPRPGRGDDDGRPHRRHAERRHPADRHARDGLSSDRRTGSSPVSSARRR